LRGDGKSDLEAGEENSGRPRQAPRQLAELIPRELDVIRLIACGLSNCLRTVKPRDCCIARRQRAHGEDHVAHILQKLGLRDRVQAVELAYETGLVQPGNALTES
jgi:DNA-binding NarL/FixJ family response regulator